MFPYEYASTVGTTFDVTFHLPDASLLACRAKAVGTVAMNEAGVGVDDGADIRFGKDTGVGDLAGVGAGALVEVGRVRSPLLTWRMLRFDRVRSCFFRCSCLCRLPVTVLIASVPGCFF